VDSRRIRRAGSLIFWRGRSGSCRRSGPRGQGIWPLLYQFHITRDGHLLEQGPAGGTGLAGISDAGDGVVGVSGDANKSGVYGNNTGSGGGVSGRSADATGVYGEGLTFGVHGKGNYGVYGETDSGYAGVLAGDVSISRLWLICRTGSAR
jgi:hypothetical protein